LQTSLAFQLRPTKYRLAGYSIGTTLVLAVGRHTQSELEQD
jgi:hypothetical protein